MLAKIVRVCHNPVHQQTSRLIHSAHYLIDEPVEWSRWKFEVAVIRQHARFAPQTGTCSHSCCVKLWQVEAYSIMLYYQSCRKEPKGGHDDALAHAEGHGRTDDAHVIFDRLDWQIALEPRGQHSHLVSPRDQSAGHSLGVDGQTTCVRPVVCQDNEYFHSEYRILSRLV